MSIEKNLFSIEDRLEKIEDLIDSLYIAIKFKHADEHICDENAENAENGRSYNDFKKFLENLPDHKTTDLYEKIEENLFKRYLLESPPGNEYLDNTYGMFLNWLYEKLTDGKFKSGLITLIEKSFTANS